MQRYLRLVCFTFGLAAVLFVSSIGALCVQRGNFWAKELSGMYIGHALHSVAWLIGYLLIAWVIGEYCFREELLNKIQIPLFLLVGHLIWSVGFSCKSLVTVGIACLFCTAVCGYLWKESFGQKKSIGFCLSALFARYLYLTVVSLFLLWMNCRG